MRVSHKDFTGWEQKSCYKLPGILNALDDIMMFFPPSSFEEHIITESIIISFRLSGEGCNVQNNSSNNDMFTLKNIVKNKVVLL